MRRLASAFSGPLEAKAECTEHEASGAALPGAGARYAKSHYQAEQGSTIAGLSVLRGVKLFLFPDGSGSPGRYIQLQPLGSDINTYGLESPFLKDPAEYSCGVEAVCQSFIAAIKREQPTGPYILGGFSLGALYAYETSRILLGEGEKVQNLFLIDMAVPKGLTAAVAPSTQELASSGLLPPGRLTKSQKEHFLSTIRAMTAYHPVPCARGQRPNRTTLIVSPTGLAGTNQSELANWARGSASSSQGWDELVGPVDRYEVNAEHFSLFKPPVVSEIFAVLFRDAF